MKQINLFLELKGRGDKDIKSIPKHENLRLQNSFLVDNNQEFITFLYREAVENDSLCCFMVPPNRCLSVVILGTEIPKSHKLQVKIGTECT